MDQNVLKIYNLVKKANESREVDADREEPSIVSDTAESVDDKLIDFCKTVEVLTMLYRLGLIKRKKSSKANDKRIKDLISTIEQNTKEKLDYILNLFLLFCSEEINKNSHVICGAIPDCVSCNLSSLCPYWNKRPSIKNLPETERPRERLINGGEELLSNAELLGIIIRAGTPNASAVDVASKLLVKYGDFRSLGTKTIAELCKIEGIGSAKAAQIKATIAIAKRYSTIEIIPGKKLSSTSAIFDHFHETLRDKKQETFLIVLLDNKNRLLKEQVISTGSLTSSIVHPREVFVPAIKEHAASVIFVHNHPSGDPLPSKEDIEITDRLKEVSLIVGIKILDHVIIGNSKYVSFKEEGLI